MNEEQTYTIEAYLRGKTKTVLTDDNLRSILADAGVTPGSDFSTLSEKQRDLSLAWLYVTIAGSPSTSQKVSDKDGDWSHSEGGETMSKDVLKNYLKMANYLFEKWGEPIVGKDRWGMICNGFHDIRSYNGRRRRA